jgi:predicted ester cyclase
VAREGEERNVPTDEENKAIFRRYVEEIDNQGNLEVADEIFDCYVSHQPDGSVLERGPEDVKQFAGEFHSAFPDFHTTIEDQIAEGDKVVTRWRARGIHQGEFRGMAPTGREVEINGIGIFRFSSEGKVVESWDSYDQLNLMRQSIEQELRMARSIQQASLPQEVPALEGWMITPIYEPARGGRRLLRLPPPIGGPPGACGGGRHGQGGARRARNVHHLRHAAARR